MTDTEEKMGVIEEFSDSQEEIEMNGKRIVFHHDEDNELIGKAYYSIKSGDLIEIRLNI